LIEEMDKAEGLLERERESERMQERFERQAERGIRKQTRAGIVATV